MSERRFPWAVFGVLTGLGLLAGVLTVWPYLLALLGLPASVGPIPGPQRLPAVLQLAGGAMMVVVVVGTGLWLAKRVGLGAPLLEGWFGRQNAKSRLGTILWQSSLVGVGAGLLGLLSLAFILLPRSAAWQMRWVEEGDTPVWQRVALAFEAAIGEELLFRLFAFSLLVWLLRRVWGRQASQPGAGVLWMANIGVALLFGLAHLPSKSFLIAPFDLAAVVLVNGSVSLALGYLYWSQGLEAAMLAHFIADIVVRVIGHALIRF